MKTPGLPSSSANILDRVPKVQRMLILGTLVLIGTGLIGVSLIYTPWQQRRLELAKQLDEEQQRANVILAMKGHEEQLAEKEKSFLLEPGETPVLTSAITRLASKTGVAVESVVPQNELRIGGGSYAQDPAKEFEGINNFLASLRANTLFQSAFSAFNLDAAQRTMYQEEEITEFRLTCTSNSEDTKSDIQLPPIGGWNQ